MMHHVVVFILHFSPEEFKCILFYLLLQHTWWNSTSLLPADSMQHDFIFANQGFSAEPGGDVQIVKSHYHILGRQLIKEEQNSGVKGGALLSEILSRSCNISEEETVSISILADAICLESISLFLLTNPLLISVSPLKPDCLFIAGKTSSHIPCLHTDPVNMA
jgi:hypothetical protein